MMTFVFCLVHTVVLDAHSSKRTTCVLEVNADNALIARQYVQQEYPQWQVVNFAVAC